jgi:NADH-quinone oxidoreductase subunit A
MPDGNPLTTTFVPIAFMVLMSALTGAGILLLSWLAGGGTRHSTAGDTIYECGLDPMDDPDKRFPVKFYVVAMLFILFDVEIALLYPWAVYFGRVATTPALRLAGLVDLLVFATILAIGYVYLYRAGAFDWARALRHQRPDALGTSGKRAA